MCPTEADLAGIEHNDGITAYLICIISEYAVCRVTKLKAVARHHVKCLCTFYKRQAAFKYPDELAS